MTKGNVVVQNSLGWLGWLGVGVVIRKVGVSWETSQFSMWVCTVWYTALLVSVGVSCVIACWQWTLWHCLLRVGLVRRIANRTGKEWLVCDQSVICRGSVSRDRRFV